jgi:palmitoyl-protein thioesterase
LNSQSKSFAHSVLEKLGYVNSIIDHTPPHKTPFFMKTAREDQQKKTGNNVPTALFHGLGDMCLNPTYSVIGNKIEKVTGGKTHCIEVGIPSLGELLNNFQHVAEKSCAEIRANPVFHGEFNVIGFSQGGLLARYIAEECEMPGKVRNMVTMGGPHMGVDAVPQCFHGVICDVVNFVVKKIINFSLVQDFVAPAGYFRDINSYNNYLKYSVFLPAMNSEFDQQDDYAQLRK